MYQRDITGLIAEYSVFVHYIKLCEVVAGLFANSLLDV